MMDYAILKDGSPRYAPKSLSMGGRIIINPTEEQYRADGWLPYVQEEYPNVEDGYTVSPVYSQEPDRIVQKWVIRKDHRPLSESEAVSMLLRQNVQSIAVDDATAVRMLNFYPTFDECKGERVKQGFKFSHEGKLYRTVQPDMEIMAIYPPGPGTESLYEIIPEQYAGDEYDPIPYSGNMALESGKYYTEDGVLYRCIRDSGIPVHDPLSRLATPEGGKYVEVVIGG